MSKKKKKFYVVWEGKETGIFSTWKECEFNTKDHKGAKYKSFETLAQAEEAYFGKVEDFWGKGKTKTPPQINPAAKQPDMNSICVDAACSGNPGKMEYQCVTTKDKQLIFKNGPFEKSTNNIGEFLAIVHALAHLTKLKDERIIYSDSTIAMGWVRQKTCKTKLVKTSENAKSFELIDRAIEWLQTNRYPNKILKWETKLWGENPADFGRK